MDGIYSPAQLALQEQHRQQQAQLQQGQGQNAGAVQNTQQHTPQHHQIMAQPQSNPNVLPRRGSVPQHSYAPPVNEASQNTNNRRPSMGSAQDMMMFNNAGGSFPYQGNMQPVFPVIDTSNVAGYGQNGEPYSAVQSDPMNTMISPQFAGMGMSNMFPPTTQEPFPDAGSGNFNMRSRSAMPNDSVTRQPSTVPQNSSTEAQSTKTSLESRDKPLSTEAQPLIRSDTASSTSREASSISAAQASSVSSAAPTISAAPPPISREKTMYSKSGFDMLKALWLVATRKNPKINLGAVDMSCAFVVTDVSMNDCPIVYVSDNFQNLTGYSQHEIVGQNCRFLQAPDGKVEAGGRREFVDNEAVYNLKKSVEDRTEVQQSLINYRKGGKPFLNLLTMIPIPWDTDEIRYFIGFQIDLVECPDAIASGQELGRVTVNYKHSDIGQYIWTPPTLNYWDNDNGQTLGADDVSTLLQLFNPNGVVSDWHKQSWDKMLLENSDDVIHVLSLKGLFLYLSPACRRVLEYDGSELVGNSLSSICHPSDIVPVTRELKEATTGGQVNVVFRIRRKQSGYTWFESHGSLYVEQGKGRKCIILVGRKRPVFALNRTHLDAHGGIGDSEIWTKISTSGLFLFVSSNVRSLLDLQPEALVGTSIQDLMRKESRAEFGRAMEKARRGKIVSCKHEVQNRRGQGLQAQTVLYPGDATEGHKPSFLLAQTKLVKASSRNNVSSTASNGGRSTADSDRSKHGHVSEPAGGGLAPGNQDAALASDDNIFDELRTTKCSSWQFELRQMEKVNRILAEELGGLLSSKKKRKRRKGVGNIARDCANCHTRSTPEWRRGPSGQRDLCNSCGLRWAKQMGRVSPRTSSRGGSGGGDAQTKKSASPLNSSPLHREIITENVEGGNPDSNSSAATSDATAKSASMMPPPGNPKGPVGAGSAMTAIQEEFDANQS